jgi:hypothetical protein
MVNEWIDAIANLILAAPGNEIPAEGPTWPSTIVRLGELTIEEAYDNRIYEGFPEADEDLASLRPFFVIEESQVDWVKYQETYSLMAHGIVDVVYTERTLRTIDGEGEYTVVPAHRVALRYFRQFADELMAWVGQNSRIAGVPIAHVRQVVFPQRTPRAQRDLADRDTDYFWAAWQFTIGEAVR